MFKDRLEDNYEIADYLEEISPQPIDIRLVRDYFFGCRAILRKCSITSLKTIEGDHHLPDIVLEKKYAKMPLKSMPPLLVEDSIIIDGHHRYRILRKKAVQKVLIYCVED